MALMDESVWRGKIFSGGWVGGDLGTGLDASVIEPATGQEIGRTGIATPADGARAARVPVGVTGVIAPFNFPQILAIRSVAPALALGNAVVLKPDPRTAVCGGVVLARVFEEAGLPDGLLHVLPGGADAGEAVVTDPA